jgi:hypothetical protein
VIQAFGNMEKNKEKKWIGVKGSWRLMGERGGWKESSKINGGKYRGNLKLMIENSEMGEGKVVVMEKNERNPNVNLLNRGR